MHASANRDQRTKRWIASPAADLGVAKLGLPGTVAAGGVETYRIRVTNHGPSTATTVVLTDHLPGGVTALDIPAGCTRTGGMHVRCKLPDIAVNTSLTRTIRVRVTKATARSRVLANVAQVTGALPDHVTGDNTDRTEATVSPAPKLAKSASADSVVAGGRVTWMLRVSNPSHTTFRHVEVCDRLPRSLIYLSSTRGHHFRAGFYCWTVATLARGHGKTYKIVTQVPLGALATIANTAAATAGTGVVHAKARLRIRPRTPVGCASRTGPKARAAC